jgi:ribonuclease Y
MPPAFLPPWSGDSGNAGVLTPQAGGSEAEPQRRGAVTVRDRGHPIRSAEAGRSAKRPAEQDQNEGPGATTRLGERTDIWDGGTIAEVDATVGGWIADTRWHKPTRTTRPAQRRPTKAAEAAPGISSGRQRMQQAAGRRRQAPPSESQTAAATDQGPVRLHTRSRDRAAAARTAGAQGLRPGGGRRAEMTTVDWVLVVAIVVLAACVVAGMVLGVRALRTLQSSKTEAKDRQEQVDVAKAKAASVRAEAAAAKAEANAARAEARRVLEAAHEEADTILEHAHRQAEADAEQVRTAARRSGEREVALLNTTAKEQAAEVERRAARIDERERLHAEEVERLVQRERRLAAMDADLAARESALAGREAGLVTAEEEHRKELERIAGLTAEVARTELVESIEAQAKREAAIVVRDIEADAKRTADTRARHIVVDAIQRIASEQTAESVVSVLHLPSDEMKGRIIGREGRNIRAFESTTGVNLIIDDTPEAVLLSCFDPVRREVGRLTLEKLVLDGRIHPHRIEEVFDSAKNEVERLCDRAAEEALVDVGITDIHPELATLLGRLRYRTSYGQNVLKHLVETAHIAGIMAAELRLDVPTMKRSAFLHDIGKALTHEVEGSHALIGADLARKYGEHEDVVHAIEAHHNEVPPQTIEAVLTQAADACSGGRPGARRESLEAYVKRLERIEEIAAGKVGVDKVFAMQAGREIRVMVRPEDIDDIGAAVLARDVAKQIEEELTYPGQIRVTVVRESRVTELAR